MIEKNCKKILKEVDDIFIQLMDKYKFLKEIIPFSIDFERNIYNKLLIVEIYKEEQGADSCIERGIFYLVKSILLSLFKLHITLSSFIILSFLIKNRSNEKLKSKKKIAITYLDHINKDEYQDRFYGDGLLSPDYIILGLDVLGFKDKVKLSKGIKHRTDIFSSLTLINVVDVVKIYCSIMVSFLVLVLGILKIKNYKLRSLNLGNYILSNLFMSLSFKVFEAKLLQKSIEKFNELDEIVILFENYGWERAVCKTAHEKFKNVKVSAYQHYAFGPNHFNLFNHKNLSSDYKPDEFWVIGNYFQRLLKEIGWDIPFKFVESYRYKYLKEINLKKTEKENLCIVLFSTSMTQNFKLLDSAKQVYYSNNDFKFIFRLHPDISIQQFGSKIPSDWNQSIGDLREELLRSRIAITGPGGVSLEALVCGNIILSPINNDEPNYSSLTTQISENIYFLKSSDEFNTNTMYKNDLNLKDLFH